MLLDFINRLLVAISSRRSRGTTSASFNAFVSRVVLECKRAVGVEFYVTKGSEHIVKACPRVLVSPLRLEYYQHGLDGSRADAVGDQ